MAKILFVCGMPGSGKSTFGKKLSHKLAWEYIDLDELIAETTGQSPASWITNKGEDVFREIESQHLKTLQISRNTVVSCGGGTPCFNTNLDWMKANGTCLFINLPLKTIYDRLNQKNGIEVRPLLSGKNPMNQIEQLWEKRKPFFEQIEWWEDGLKLDLEELALRTVSIFEKF